MGAAGREEVEADVRGEHVEGHREGRRAMLAAERLLDDWSRDPDRADLSQLGREIRMWLARINAFLDHFLRGKGTRPKMNVS